MEVVSCLQAHLEAAFEVLEDDENELGEFAMIGREEGIEGEERCRWEEWKRRGEDNGMWEMREKFSSDVQRHF